MIAKNLLQVGGLVSALALFAAGGAQAALIPIDSYAGGMRTGVLGINNAGWMTGSIVFEDGHEEGFVRDAGGVYSLFALDDFTQGRAINEANGVTGFAMGPSRDLSQATEFLRDAGGTVTVLTNPVTAAPLNGIAQGMNSSGAITGDYFNGVNFRGYILDGGTLTTVLPAGATRSAVRDIANDGTAVGWASFSGGVRKGFIFSGGSIQVIDNPFVGSKSMTFESTNQDGKVLGIYLDSAGFNHSFLFDRIANTFHELVVAGAKNVQAFGLNDLGQVVLTTDIEVGPNNFLYTPDPVPEPATWALMILGFGAAGAMMRRRRAAAAG